ncbi:hypothetical protein QPK87_23770 [Kamptonema cortianum]|nr:hypothetical protein [Oscillatoria laete-virens]MDK3159569.1 hypothetical protein [Kamptonema cortianum]MDL5053294.1 hypothetical protein [Oscillatoria laete-virens NRMC-F 0139]
MRKIFLSLALLFMGGIAPVWAQVRVELNLGRLEFLQYEAITATVKITNMSSRPLIFGEVDEDWLSFRIEDAFGNIIPRTALFRGTEYVKIDPGMEATRSVNLTPMYSIHKPGRYKVEAVVRVNDRTFRSTPKPLEIREGKLLWQDRIGVIDPDSNREEFRSFALIQFPRVGDPFLYLQVLGENNQMVYATTRLAPIISSGSIAAEFDRDQRLHVLFQTDPKAYGYYVAENDGKQVDAAVYTSYNSIPKLKIDPQRRIGVVGGNRQADPNSGVPQAPRFIPPPLPPSRN